MTTTTDKSLIARSLRAACLEGLTMTQWLIIDFLASNHNSAIQSVAREAITKTYQIRMTSEGFRMAIRILRDKGVINISGTKHSKIISLSQKGKDMSTNGGSIWPFAFAQSASDEQP